MTILFIFFLFFYVCLLVSYLYDNVLCVKMYYFSFFFMMAFVGCLFVDYFLTFFSSLQSKLYKGNVYLLENQSSFIELSVKLFESKPIISSSIVPMCSSALPNNVVCIIWDASHHLSVHRLIHFCSDDLIDDCILFKHDVKHLSDIYRMSIEIS